MKKILLILVACIALFACENDRPTYDSGTNNTEASKVHDSDTVAQANESPDLRQAYEKLNESIQNDSNRITSVEQHLQEVDKQLANKVEVQIAYVLFGVCALLLVLVLVSLMIVQTQKKRNEEARASLRHLGKIVNNLQLKSEDNVSLCKRLLRELSDYRSDIERLSEEIVALERKLSKFDAGRVNIEPPKGGKPSYEEEAKSGYLGVNNDNGIIGKCFSSATEEAVFRYYAKSGNTVDFEPLSLKRIKSISSIRKAVIFQGALSLQDANDMSVIHRGQAVQREVNGQKIWEITIPAEVKLK